jgi:hypothetical protein
MSDLRPRLNSWTFKLLIDNLEFAVVGPNDTLQINGNRQKSDPKRGISTRHSQKGGA